MPPRKKGKECEAIVLVLDVGASVKDKYLDGQSFLDKTKECVSMILQRKIFSGSIDEVGVILFASDETKNELADDDFCDQYQHINVVTDWLMIPTWDIVKNVHNLCGTNVNNADWLDALIVAMQFMKTQTEAKSFSELKIVLFSNFASDIKSQEQVDTIMNTLKALDIHITVIGPDITTDYSECSEDDSVKKSETQIEGENLIGKIVNETNGIICTFEQAMSQLMYFEKSTTKPMPWNVALSIGNDIKIPVSGYKKLAEPKSLKWVGVSAEDGKPLMTEQSFFLSDQCIERPEVIDGYRYGTAIIPFSSVDKEVMKYVSGERSLKVLGFTKVNNIPMHLINSYSPYYIVPQRDNEGANVMLTSLVKALEEMKMAAVVTKVYNRGNAPYVGALYPKIENEHAYLVFVQLPFANEVNYLKFPPVSRKSPSDEQLEAIDKLIDYMDLTEVYEDDDEEPYVPDSLMNPQKQHLYQCIAQRALDPDSEVLLVPCDTVINMLKPMPEIEERARETIEEIKLLFPLNEVKKKINKKAVSDVFVNDDEEETKPVQKSEEVNEDIAIANLLQNVIAEVGTVNPEANFQELLDRGEPHEKVCEQMKDVIKKLLLRARATDNISKALSALSTLRKHCAIHNPDIYNNWICTLKNIVTERGAIEHWELIAQDNLGLITLKESEQSTISQVEAEKFYEVEKPDTYNEYDMDVDDLLDQL